MVKPKVPFLSRQESFACPWVGWRYGELSSAPSEAQGLGEKEQWFIIEKLKWRYRKTKRAGKPDRGLHSHQQCLRGLLSPNPQQQSFLFSSELGGNDILFYFALKTIFICLLASCNPSFVDCSFSKLEPSPFHVLSVTRMKLPVFHHGNSA